VTDHPVRLTVDDDLRRSRLTVLFRLILLIPHALWWWGWSIVAFLVAIVNWVATLIRGRPPAGLHTFLASYVRYTTHLYAYAYLAANPWPMFTGRPGYPVDLEIDDPAPQRRWTVALRLLIAIPALALAAAFAGSGPGAWSESDHRGAALTYAGGTLLTVAFFGWFASLARGRMPQGFRDLQAFGLRYLAQMGAYLLVLTDRYPDVDPAATPATGVPHPVSLAIEDDLRRSRLTVFFRLLLTLPHLVWLFLWWVVAFLAAIAMWFAALVIGRPPAALHRFLSAFLRYATHVYAYLMLTANPFPGFTGRAGSYPIDPRFPPPERQRRLVTAFRLFLAIPALAVSGALGALLFIGAFLGWFASLALGRMPRSLREAQTYALRYSTQVSAYLLILTERYPHSGPIRPETTS
jgi:uncharacterized protein DUF4389